MATVEELVVRASMKDDLSRPVRGVRGEVRELRREIDNTGTSAYKGTRSLDRLTGGAGRLARATGRGLVLGLKATATAIAGVTAAAIVGGAKLVGLASDAAETGAAFETVFRGVEGNVGKYVDRLNKRFGITTAELQRAATTFGVFGKAAGVTRKDLGGFTKDLVTAGLDLSSFYNADPTEVFTALRSGLAGEAEPLRQFGIFLSDATLKAEAATMGLTGELNESQKVMVRQRIIMKSLGDANGDLERTSGGFANQWRKLKGQLKEGATVIGTALLPVVTPLVSKLGDGLGPVVERLSDSLPRFVTRLSDTAHQLNVTRELAASGDWELAVANLDRMTGAGGNLEGAWAMAAGVMRDVRDVIRNGLLPGIRDVTGAIDPAWLTPLGAARGALSVLADNAWLVRGAVIALTAALLINRAVSLGVAAAAGIASAATFIQTASTYGLSYALTAGGTAARLYTVAQWAMNAAMWANPVGVVVLAIVALVAIFVLLYKKSETFRRGLSVLWDGMRAVGSWIKDQFVASFDRVSDAISALVGWIKRIKFPSPPGWLTKGFGNPFGDTVTSRAAGAGGGLGISLGYHRQLAGNGIRVSNALVGGGGRGHGSGDHQAGRALDLVGPGLNSYKARLEKAGGYGAFHGSSSGRHLHAVYPAGDTATPRASRTSTSGSPGGGMVVMVPITVEGNASEVDRIELERAVRKALRAAERERLERAGAG